MIYDPLYSYYRIATPGSPFLPYQGNRCIQAGVRVPDSVFAGGYPSRRRRELGEVEDGEFRALGITPTPSDCYIYCSNYYPGVLHTYFNLRVDTTPNQCFCCGDTCTLINDPAYGGGYEVLAPAPNDPIPPLPDYELQGVGQRCAELGTLKLPFVPADAKQCWRLCSYNDAGVPQPNTYFNLKTSTDPDQCYCVVSQRHVPSIVVHLCFDVRLLNIKCLHGSHLVL